MQNYKLKQLARDYKKTRRDNWSTKYRELSAEAKRTKAWLWNRNYQLYLGSADWKVKRAKVLKRDDHKCVVCDEQAEHVHHLSYDRVFDESLFDLVSVCNECHEAIHYDKLVKERL